MVSAVESVPAAGEVVTGSWERWRWSCLPLLPVAGSVEERLVAGRDLATAVALDRLAPRPLPLPLRVVGMPSRRRRRQELFCRL